MNLIARATLIVYGDQHPETKVALIELVKRIRTAEWTSMDEVQRAFSRATVLNGERVKFDVCGGNYRVIVAFKFSAKLAFVKFVGTHGEYDRINALTVSQF